MKKIILVYPDEKRDITKIYDSHRAVSEGVRVNYHSSIVNKKIVPERHQILHRGARIEQGGTE